MWRCGLRRRLKGDILAIEGIVVINVGFGSSSHIHWKTDGIVAKDQNTKNVIFRPLGVIFGHKSKNKMCLEFNFTY